MAAKHRLSPNANFTVPASALATTDLHVDATYEGSRIGNAADDALSKLLSVDNQGGFRKRGSANGKLHLLVLLTGTDDPDWPDDLDPETGVFTYYGDNKKPGQDLLKTGRRGNLILQRVFAAAQGAATERAEVPPIFVFSKAGTHRDVTFLGLAVPGATGLRASEELVAIWHTSSGRRFQNYRARFTILDAQQISRAWLDSLIKGEPSAVDAPDAWLKWLTTGRRTPLLAPRTTEYRSARAQLPLTKADSEIVECIHAHFAERPRAFEYCAGVLARLMIPDIVTLDVTRPSRDGGRDAVGKMRIGSGPSAIIVDFALEAKCYALTGSVGVREMSRLISRLRHRQFGILVTTGTLNLQAYKEIKEDQHPIIVIAACDIVQLLRRHGRGTVAAVRKWLNDEFSDAATA